MRQAKYNGLIASETVEVSIVVEQDVEHAGFFVAYEPDAAVHDFLARAKTPGMALAQAYEELGRRALEVERALRSRMEPAELAARGL